MLLGVDTQLSQHSYYEASVQRWPLGAVLQGTLNADVVVIGAGFSGLSAAIELAQRGMQVVVLEADRVGSGASGRNGGQAIVGFASGQAVFERQLGLADARRAWDLSLQAIALIDERIAHYQIDCDRVHGYLCVADSPQKADQLEAQVHALARDYNFQSNWARAQDTLHYIQSAHYCAAAFESTSGHLHPLKYALGLARAARQLGVRIFEKSAVVDLQRGSLLRARTASGAEVGAKWGVLAGNCTLAAYGAQVAPEIAKRIMPVGTYMVATAPLAPALCRHLIPSRAAVCDNNLVLDYFRFSADHRLLFGGRVSYTTQTPSRLKLRMAQRIAAIFPALRDVPLDYVWGGFVDISTSRAPDFGRLGHNLYYLQGFSGHGVALTGMAGRLVAEALTGQAERFDVLARLKNRAFPGGALLRMPTLALAMLYHRLRDLL
jgi:gamma-glutamylputrescine oxidase